MSWHVSEHTLISWDLLGHVLFFVMFSDQAVGGKKHAGLHAPKIAEGVVFFCVDWHSLCMLLTCPWDLLGHVCFLLPFRPGGRPGPGAAPT